MTKTVRIRNLDRLTVNVENDKVRFHMTCPTDTTVLEMQIPDAEIFMGVFAQIKAQQIADEVAKSGLKGDIIPDYAILDVEDARPGPTVPGQHMVLELKLSQIPSHPVYLRFPYSHINELIVLLQSVSKTMLQKVNS
jgi:hypothetical protein